MINLLSINVCDQESVLKTLKIVYLFITIVKILVPIIIIFFGIKDLFNTIVSGKEDELKTNINMFVKRIIAGLVIFLIPSIIDYFLSLTSKYQETATKFTSCSVCITNGTECDVLIESAKEKTSAQAENYFLTEADVANRKKWIEQNNKNFNKQRIESGKKTNNQDSNNSNNNNINNIERKTVSNGKYFDSTDVTRISGLTEEEFIEVLQNSTAYKGKAKVYIPLAHDLILAEKNHGVNAFYLIGLYSYESGWLGSELTKNCNNIGGVRYYKQTYGNGKTVTDCNGGYAGFDSISEFIDFHANLLEVKYLTPGGSHYYGTSVANVAKDYGSSNGVDTIIRIATNVSTQ